MASDESAGEADASHSTSSRTVISRKELARQLRRQAYQKAKQARAVNPKYIAMKEAAKVRRREVYQQVKARRKEEEKGVKAREKVAAAAARTEAKRKLAERVRSAIGAASEPGRALARDIDRALQSAEVRELMERLRAESAELAAEHQNAPGADGIRAGVMDEGPEGPSGELSASAGRSSSPAAPSSRARPSRAGSPD